jgi:hypothetical protein
MKVLHLEKNISSQVDGRPDPELNTACNSSGVIYVPQYYNGTRPGTYRK